MTTKPADQPKTASDFIIFGPLISTATNRNVFLGRLKLTKQEIVIKQYSFHKPAELTQRFNELFCQAKLKHPGICDIINVFLDKKPEEFNLILCLEKLEQDLSNEILRRLGNREWYREEELWEFLQSTVEAMSFAQKQVLLGRTFATET